VAPGAELMPHRFNLVNYASLASNDIQVDSGSFNLEKYATPVSNVDQANSGSFNLVKYATLVCNGDQVDAGSSEQGSTSIPIKTLTRNRGLVMREDSAMTDSQGRSSLDEEVLFHRSKSRHLNDSSAL
jgi:hypothetical protein